ncbi:ABC transporter permease [Kaistia algarum]|uniref:ABC transporter permease n=1 Tax=Kaistia algarum TaxID=2083279 RepID=UPI000CE918CD|nr:ABC transporter permease [Kaistia algarum]MCX5515737.1 ABC transporter permease [Kaistia algarum]PPE80888.1 ABC transporter permease [Kaistia algarum]
MTDAARDPMQGKSPDAAARGTSDAARLRAGRGRMAAYRYAVVFALLILVAGFSVLLPNTFFTLGNFRTIVSSQAVLMILALGLTLPLTTGEFDLSVGSMLGCGAVLTAYFTGVLHLPLVMVVIATVLVGVLAGAINGLFVVRIGINAFIGTLGTSTILMGLTLAVSGGQILNTVAEPLSEFVQYQIFGLAVPVYIGFGLAIGLWYLYEHTPTGRHLFFVGEGREAARLTGLGVDRLRFAAFIGSGAISAGAGVLTAGQLGAADPSVGPSFLLPAYAAAFLGAATIKPGRFNAWGTVVALYLLVTGVTGLELLGTSSWVQEMFNGIALLIAVTFARFVARNQVA